MNMIKNGTQEVLLLVRRPSRGGSLQCLAGSLKTMAFSKEASETNWTTGIFTEFADW